MAQPLAIAQKSLLVFFRCCSSVSQHSLAIFIGVLLLSKSVAATPTKFSSLFKATVSTGSRELPSKADFTPLTPSPPHPPQLWGGEEGEREFQSPPVLGDLGGFKDLFVHRSLNKGSWGDSSSIAQQPTTNQQDATRAAAEQVYQEGYQLYKQGTAESLRQAIAKWQEVLPLYRAIGDKEGEARTLNNIGFIYDALGEKQKALEFYNQSLPMFRATGDKEGEATTLNNIGKVYNALGEKQKALEFYNQSLPLRRATGDKEGEATTLNNIGFIYDNLGQKQKALEYYNQSLPLSRATGDKAGEAVTLSNIGKVYSDLGQKQKALDFFNQSLSLRRATGDKTGEAGTLSNIGAVYDALGEKQKALEFYNQSLPLSRATGDKEGEAVTLSNIGKVYNDLGQKQKALEYYNQSLPLSRATRDKAQEAVTLSNIGAVYDALGEKQKALEFYNQSLPMFRATGDKAGEAVTLNNIGGVYDGLGQKQKALEYYNQSLPLSRATGDKAGEAVTLSNIGAIYGALGEKQKALEFYNQSLPLARVTGDKTQEATTLSNIGKVYDDLGQKQKALEFYNQSLPMFRVTGDKAREAVTLYNLAYLERNQGNLNSALTQIEAAITIIEDLRTKIASQELRASFFAQVQNQGYYEFYIDLLMQLHKTNPNQGYDAQALNASERSRARGLLELLTEAGTDIRQGVDPKLVDCERTLQQQLDAIEKRRIQILSGNHTKEQAEAIEREQITLLEAYRQVQADIRATSPSYAALTQPKPLTLAEIQQQVLDDDTLLLQYSLGKDRSYLWAVTKTSINSYELPKRADIEKAAQSFYQQTGKQKAPEQRGLGAVPREDSLEVTTQLSQMLLSPVAGQLANKRLLIVGDGVLQYLPFAALPAPDSLGKGENDEANLSPNPSPRRRGESDSPLPLQGRGVRGVRSSLDKNSIPLIVQHEIVNSPSASTIAILRQDTKGRKVAPKMIAVIADPVFSQDDERVKTLVGQASRLSQRGDGKISTARGGQDAHPTSQDVELSALTLTRSAREASITFQRLPFTRKESDRILSLIPNTQSQSAFDFAANRATATSPELGQYQIVHFATHGILNSQNPELSGVVLSLVDEKGIPQNGFLRLNDIFNLNLPAELIVLSACETGLGKEIKGEGLVGLTRGFMYAGSPRILVSLWSVADEGTSELMTRFYKKMMEDKLPAAAALRAAQIEMLQNEQWKNPYYWAAFTIQGEWR